MRKLAQGARLAARALHGDDRVQVVAVVKLVLVPAEPVDRAFNPRSKIITHLPLAARN
jgi:hypothetical protein